MTSVERSGLPLRWPNRILPLLLLVIASLAPGVVRTACAAWMVPPAPYRAKDFCLIKDRDGLYHVFYIRNNVTLSLSQTEVDFGHAVSANLWTWAQLPAVVPVRPGMWDHLHVWAPHVVEVDSVYYMFYTGVTDVPGQYAVYQRMGLATSTDLMTWNRIDDPVFSCDQVQWSFCDSLDYRTAFRDPFVMKDPSLAGGWLMYYTTTAVDDTTLVVGVAHSSGDFTQWEDVKGLWNTYHPLTNGSLTESPHVFRYKDLWYLFYTTFFRQSLQFQTSSNPTGEIWEWTARGSLGAMLGIDTAAWFASEHLQDGLLDFLAFVEYDRVSIYRMMSNTSDHTFYLQQPDRFRVRTVAWGTDSARVHDQVPLVFRSVDTQGLPRTVPIEALERFTDGTERLIPVDSLALPPSVTLFADSMVVPWGVRTLPDSSDSARVLRLVVRTADRTASTGILAIRPDTSVADPPPVDPGALPGADPSEPEIEEQMIRPLRYSPFGVPSMLVRMEAEGPARVDLYDLQGRRVRNLADRVLPQGASVLGWDGRDAQGLAAAAGVYFVRLETTRGASTARFVHLP